MERLLRLTETCGYFYTRLSRGHGPPTHEVIFKDGKWGIGVLGEEMFRTSSKDNFIKMYRGFLLSESMLREHLTSSNLMHIGCLYQLGSRVIGTKAVNDAIHGMELFSQNLVKQVEGTLRKPKLTCIKGESNDKTKV